MTAIDNTSDDPGTGRTVEPLVGRGSASRVDSGTGEPGAPGAPAGSASERRRSVPRPPLVRARSRRPWAAAKERLPAARLALGGGLVVVLFFAWVAVGRQGAGSAAPPAVPPATPSTTLSTTPASNPAPTARPRTVPIAHAVAVPAWVPAAIAATCRARATAPRNVTVECTPGRGVLQLEYRGFESIAALRAAYTSALHTSAPPRARGGHSAVGPAACAGGATDERSWSVALEPTVAVGRFACALVGRRARITWTTEAAAVLASATRSDGDLRALYQWWTTVPGPSVAGATRG
jgi:hypothetical protein